MSKVQRKTLSSSRTSSGSKIQTGAGNHQLQKKNSASALVEKAKLKAEADAEEKVKKETEKLVEEKRKVSMSV